MDLITWLPKFEVKDAIFVVIGRLKIMHIFVKFKVHAWQEKYKFSSMKFINLIILLK